MTHTEYLLRNINFNDTVKILSRDEYYNLLVEKLTPAYEYLSQLKRVYKKNRKEAVNLVKNDLIPFGETTCAYLKQDFLGYVNDSIKEAFKWDFYFRVDFDERQFEHPIFKYLFENWNNEDLEQLKLICSNFSYPEAASSYFFMTKFKDDGRLDAIKKMYLSENVTEDRFKGHIEFFADSTINLKYLSIFLTYIVTLKEKSIKHGVAIKRCKKTNSSYVERLHLTKYSEWQLYLPYSPKVLSKKYNMKNALSKDESLDALKKMSDLLGGVPESGEFDFPFLDPATIPEIMDIWIDIPFSKYYIKEFGSFKVALFEAGIIDEKALRNKFGISGIAKDGHFFRSLAEQKIDNWLYENNIKHSCEPEYPYDEDLNKNKMRADWLVGNVYIEYFGLPEQDFYSRKMDIKFKLAEKKNLNCIYLYPVDLLNLEEKLNMLRNVF